MIFVAWLVFSIVVGMLAHGRGRSGVGWGFLAGAISPLLAGILLYVAADLNALKEQEKMHRQQQDAYRGQEQARTQEAAKIDGQEVFRRVDKLHELHLKQVLSDAEFAARKT